MKIIKRVLSFILFLYVLLGIGQYVKTSEANNLAASAFCLIIALFLLCSSLKKKPDKITISEAPTKPSNLPKNVLPSANQDITQPDSKQLNIKSESAVNQLESSPKILNESLNQLNKTLSSENIAKITVQRGITPTVGAKSKTSYIEDDKKITRNDEKEISDEEVPALIQAGYEETMQKNSVAHNYPVYMNMRIVSNTIPAHENYAVLNDNEKLFFQALHKQLTEAKLSPSLIKFTRMSDGSFNVDYIGLCYIGKINLYQSPTKYTIIKSGNKRATKVFDTLQEAENFVSQNKNYEVEIRQPKTSNSMQYLRGSSTIKNLSDLSIEQCIEYIPYWIRYIKYCKRN